MAISEFRLSPAKDIVGEGPRWRSESEEPWFRLSAGEEAAGRWIRLVWSVGLIDPMCRPVLRFVFETGFRDIFLPGCPFGSMEFIVFFPSDAKDVLLSPCNYVGEFGFRVERMDVVRGALVFATAMRRAPALALLAAGAALIGRKSDAKGITRAALARKSFRDYPRWKEAGIRAYESQGIDGVLPRSKGQVRLICPGQNADRAWLTRLIGDLDECADVSVETMILAAPEMLREVRSWFLDNPKVLVVHLDATPEILTSGMANDGLVGLVRQETHLEPLAFARLMLAQQRNPASEIFYGEEERVTDDGKPLRVNFKPGFDPLVFDVSERVGAATFVRADVVRAGNARIERSASGPQWRFKDIASGTSLSRILMRVRVRENDSSDRERPASTPGAPAATPADEVAVIIPTKDRLELLKPCVTSLLKKTKGNFRIVIVDNGTSEPAALEYLHSISKEQRISVVHAPGPFNFSSLSNRGAQQVQSRILVFLNNDTEVISEDWLAQVVPVVSRADVGAVGAKLLFRNRRVQHGGCVVGLGGRAGHFEHGLREDDEGYFGRANIPHQVSAVTGAFLAVERHKFEMVGRFDAVNLPVDLNDIDLCLRLHEAGYRNIMVPSCRFYHYESASRGHLHNPDIVYGRERAYFSRRWFHMLRADPFFSPLLSLHDSDASLG